MPHLDLIADVLERVAQRGGVARNVLQDVEREVRAEWGGSRQYINRVGESGRQDMMQRDARIRSDAARLKRTGMADREAVDYLSRRYNLGVKRISQILQQDVPAWMDAVASRPGAI